jgi:hypothetical protein
MSTAYIMSERGRLPRIRCLHAFALVMSLGRLDLAKVGHVVYTLESQAVPEPALRPRAVCHTRNTVGSPVHARFVSLRAANGVRCCRRPIPERLHSNVAA